MADLGGRSMIEVADSRVETSNTAESRRRGNLIHRQMSLIDELLGKMKASRLSYRERIRSQVSEEQPAEMPRPYSQSFCETFNSSVPKPAFTD